MEVSYLFSSECFVEEIGIFFFIISFARQVLKIVNVSKVNFRSLP
jgi:hypothetical protein